MRPTDENQHGSTRPNLGSGTRRPAGGEDNILAKLDRDAARGSPKGSIAGGRRVLVAMGGVLIAGLVGTLAWLAHENAVTKRILPGAAVEVVAAPPPAPVAQPAPVLAATPAPAAPARAGLDPGERIVRPAPAEIVTGIEDGSLPPLVLVQPAHSATAKAAPAPMRRAAIRPALAASRKPAAPPVPAAKADPQPVDNDVALLSAIIMHASSHAAERAQLETPACAPGKRCPAKE